jgi:RNA polymerase-binding transcription factor DksA
VDPRSGLTEGQAQLLYLMLKDARWLALERHERLNEAGFTTERSPQEEAADTVQSTTGLAASERARLVQLERALRKMESGTYGVSEASGEPIGFDRLSAVPWARLTAAEEEKLEREAVQRGR